jgi:protein SCO1/2
MKGSRSSPDIKLVTAQRRLFRLYHLVWLGLGMAGAALIAGSYWYYTRGVDKAPDPPGVQTVMPPESIPAFSLVDQHGKPFTQSQMLGKWTVMFFGYTHCPDFCPTTLAGLNSAYHRLERQAPKHATSTQVVFVSVDPFRDTLPLIGDFVSHFNKEFIGATGATTQLHRLTAPLGASYDYSDPASQALLPDSTRPALRDYVVDHSSGLYIFDAQARLVAWVLPPHTAERIVSVYENIRSRDE